MKNIKIYIYVIALLSFFSCDVINPVEPIPAYIHVKNFEVNSGGVPGSAAAKITDGYLYINNEFLGVYDLPKTIPVIASGETSILVDPGIKENGISATPNIYPFLERFSTMYNLEEGKVDTITPTTTYIQGAKFSVIENFEGTNIFTYDSDGDSMNLPSLFSAGAFEGQSAKFSVSTDYPFAEVAMMNKIQLPTNGTETYMELHYKNDGLLQVGLIGYEEGSSTPIKFFKLTLNERQDWNKVYINFTDELIASDLFEYQLVLRGDLPSGATSASFFIDNIKLIHF